MLLYIIFTIYTKSILSLNQVFIILILLSMKVDVVYICVCVFYVGTAVNYL